MKTILAVVLALIAGYANAGESEASRDYCWRLPESAESQQFCADLQSRFNRDAGLCKMDIQKECDWQSAGNPPTIGYPEIGYKPIQNSSTWYISADDRNACLAAAGNLENAERVYEMFSAACLRSNEEVTEAVCKTFQESKIREGKSITVLKTCYHQMWSNLGQRAPE